MAGQGLQHIPLGRAIPDKWDPAWFAKFIREVLAFADARNALEGAGITITGQPGEPATISTSADIQALLEQKYVVTAASTFLPNERILSGENGVVSITDGGAGQPITVGIYDGGLPYTKLGELDELSVLGNATDTFGPVTRISGSAQHDVLSVQLDGSDLVVQFGAITHESVSDFDEAAQDAVGGILTASDTISFTYTDATPAITADVRDDSITYALMQETSADSILLGRGDSAAGNPEEITLGAGLTMTGTVLSVAGGGGSVVGCHVQRTTTLSVPTANTEVMIPWDTEVADDGAFWASSPDPTRLTIPYTGWYSVAASATWASETGIRRLRIAVNGSALTSYDFVSRGEMAGGASLASAVAAHLYLTAGDYVEVGATDNTSARNISGATAAIVKFP